MDPISRTIRLFVSSPFNDLKAERNALQAEVFPRLQKHCQASGWSFQAIDLRWGVSTEAALDQSAMRICLAEIARCQAVTPRPNFLVLLGDPYGWRPLPDTVHTDAKTPTKNRYATGSSPSFDLSGHRGDRRSLPTPCSRPTALRRPTANRLRRHGPAIA